MDKQQDNSIVLLAEENSTADLPSGVIALVRGRAGAADRVNANRRLYPASVYRKAIRQFNAARRESQPAINAGSSEDRGAPVGRPWPDQPEVLLGELDHPGAGEGPRLSKTAFHITRLSLSEGRYLDFTGRVLNTPHGRALRSLLEAGIPVSVSTRGTGTLAPCCAHSEAAGSAHDDHPYWRVGDDYELHGIDAVARGAHAGAYMIAAMEGRAESSSASCEERNDGMDLVETPPSGTEAEASLRIAELESRLRAANSDLELLQTAAASEREALGRALDEARTESLAAVLALEERLAAAIAERDQAAAALSRREVETHVAALLHPLRPDVRQKVADQLRSCKTIEDVTERWTAIEQILGAAGLSREAPGGSGRVHAGDDASAGSLSSALTPTQQVQRRLLGIG